MAAARLHVVVHQAEQLIAADSNGKSDPYCILKLGRKKFQTKTIKDTVDPQWNEGISKYRLYQ